VTFVWLPLLILLLVVPVLVGMYAWSLRRRRPRAARYSSVALLREAGVSRARARRHLPFALVAGSAAALVLALGRPAVVLSVPVNETTIILSMDVSGSMCSTDIAPTRLEAAEAAAIAFVQSQGSHTQIGLVAFSGFAAVIQPPTSDQSTLIDAIHSLTTGRRTAVGSGILAGIDAISDIDPDVARSVQEGRPGAEPPPVPEGAYVPDIIVLLTDGASNAGPEPLDAAQQAVTRGVRVYTIGFGTEGGGSLEPVCRRQFIGNEPGGGFGFPGGFSGGSGGFLRGIDEDTLKEVAKVTGGSYHTAETADELQRVFAELPTSLITKTEPVEVSVGFLGLGFALAAAGLLLGRAWRPLP
jgi:Ca-activated chloride channel family protein